MKRNRTTSRKGFRSKPKATKETSNIHQFSEQKSVNSAKKMKTVKIISALEEIFQLDSDSDESIELDRPQRSLDDFYNIDDNKESNSDISVLTDSGFSSSYESCDLNDPQQSPDVNQQQEPEPTLHFKIGSRLEDQNNFGKWYSADIINIEGQKIRVHFERYNDRFDQWTSLPSSRLKTTSTSPKYSENEEVLVVDSESKLHLCHVVEVKGQDDIKVLNQSTGCIRPVSSAEIYKMPDRYKRQLEEEFKQYGGGIPLETWSKHFPHLLIVFIQDNPL